LLAQEGLGRKPNPIMHITKPIRLFILLNGIFLTFLIMAEVTGAKLFSSFGYTLTIGVIPFPITFLVTDILNEYYGRRGVRYTTFLGMAMILLAYMLIVIDVQIPATNDSPVDDASFEKVFANSGLIIIGSITAYLIGQLIDINIFHYLRLKTKGKYIWLRSTGSTIASQLLDSFIVIFIAFGAKLPFEKLISIASNNFFYKMLVAIAITPLIYLCHKLIEKYLGEEAKSMTEKALLERL